MKTEQNVAEVSFRDPGGCVCIINNRVIRIINQTGQKDFRELLASRTAQKFINRGILIGSSVLDNAEIKKLSTDAKLKRIILNNDQAMVVEHERVPFPSYPYEWPPEMLYCAGRLTLEMALELTGESFGLKDGTPYNILFKGPEPVFIDVLSIERRDPGDYIWLPYAQFVRTFMLPLVANKYFHMPLEDIFLTRRDGLEPEEIYHLCSPLQRFKKPFLSLVSMPKWLAGKHNQDDQSIYRKKLLADPEKAKFILDSILHRLLRNLGKLAPTGEVQSVWSNYMESNNNYSGEQITIKQEFVNEMLSEFQPKKVLDVGCNTGFFSFLAAKTGCSVVAIDYDPVVVGKVWRQASQSKLDILPLVVNLTRPTPATGWRNREWPSFLERARGAFEMVLMLAVIHHMMVSERIPLDEILEQAAELTTDLLVIEYVDPADSMFRRLTRGRDHLFEYLTREFFESVCNRYFQIIRSKHIEGSHRWLYLLRKKGI